MYLLVCPPLQAVTCIEDHTHDRHKLRDLESIRVISKVKQMKP